MRVYLARAAEYCIGEAHVFLLTWRRGQSLMDRSIVLIEARLFFSIPVGEFGKIYLVSLQPSSVVRYSELRPFSKLRIWIQPETRFSHLKP